MNSVLYGKKAQGNAAVLAALIAAAALFGGCPAGNENIDDCDCAPNTVHYDADCPCPARGTDKCGCTRVNTPASVTFRDNEVIPVTRGSGVSPQDFITAVGNVENGYASLSDAQKNNLIGKIKEIQIVSTTVTQSHTKDGDGLVTLYLKYDVTNTYIKDLLEYYVNNGFAQVKSVRNAVRFAAARGDTVSEG